MDQLIFATNNQHKVSEVKAILEGKYDVISLSDAGIDIDIPEPYETLEENAIEKAKVIHKMTGKNCFGEDTGLEVMALNGEPGVKSARYAGEEKSFSNNTIKLLSKLDGVENRKAQFRAVIALVFNGKLYTFEGVCKGLIIASERGTKGFGYDPVFVPDGSDKTFGEMEMEEKNLYNHRQIAVNKMIDFLKSTITTN